VAEITGLELRPVRGRKELNAFIKLPWQIYAGDPAWVPPLIREQRKILDRSRHPFHLHAEVEYFLARRGGRVVGRIAVFVNPRYNRFHEDRTGFFGFLEVENDPEACTALLECAEGWLAERAMDCMVGPMNFTTNDESHSPGILLEGFQEPPYILMAHGRPYYPSLLKEAGLEKAMDLLAYRFTSNIPPERIVKAVARIEKGIAGLRIRNVSMKHLHEEVDLVQAVYNSAWEKNWGFVPLTEAEIRHLAEELKPILEPRYALIATIHGQAVGFSLTLPDYNQALRHTNGRLLPLGLLKLLWHARRINRARVFALGLERKFRRSGIDAVLYLRTFLAAQELGHGSAESSWILEDNWTMRRALEKMGAHIYKRYRVYQKALTLPTPR
jgi:hypothetical protein